MLQHELAGLLAVFFLVNRSLKDMVYAFIVVSDWLVVGYLGVLPGQF